MRKTSLVITTLVFLFIAITPVIARPTLRTGAYTNHYYTVPQRQSNRSFGSSLNRFALYTNLNTLPVRYDLRANRFRTGSVRCYLNGLANRARNNFIVRNIRF